MDGATAVFGRCSLALVFVLVSYISLWVPTAYASETTTYVLTDAQGTVLAREDAHGTTIATYDYRPYGSRLGRR